MADREPMTEPLRDWLDPDVAAPVLEMIRAEVGEPITAADLVGIAGALLLQAACTAAEQEAKQAGVSAAVDVLCAQSGTLIDLTDAVLKRQRVRVQLTTLLGLTGRLFRRSLLARAVADTAAERMVQP